MRKPKKKIRVLFTIPNFRTAGSQYVVLSLFTRINKDVFEPLVCVENYLSLIPKEVPEESQLMFQWSGNRMVDVSGFKNLLEKNDINIVHSWDYKSNYLEALAAKIAGVKYCYTKKNNAWSKRWMLKSLLSSHIAYDNPEMKKRFFDSMLFKNKISFVPHGVDTELFRPFKPLLQHNFNLVCIGNIVPNKNQLFLVKALNQLPEIVVLHLYGKEDADYRKELDTFINENDLDTRVHFHGYVQNTDIPEIFRNMDVFVLPSINEGLPVSILEALSCGIPTLSSNSGGGSRYLLDSTNIFSLNNPNELIQKINKFQEMKISERDQISKRERQKVLLQHTIEREVLAYQNLYKEIITKNKQ